MKQAKDWHDVNARAPWRPAELVRLEAALTRIRDLAQPSVRSGGFEPRVSGTASTPADSLDPSTESFRRMMDAGRLLTRDLAARLESALAVGAPPKRAGAGQVAERCPVVRCRKRNRSGARFCDGCGNALASTIRARSAQRVPMAGAR